MDKKTLPTIQEAIEEAGGVRQLAELLGYTRGRVYQWLAEGRSELPELAAYRYRSKVGKP